MKAIYLVNYAGASKAAIEGVIALLVIANRMAERPQFKAEIVELAQISKLQQAVVVIPPCMHEPLPDFKQPEMLQALKDCSKQGNVLASNCAGVFWLAEAGLLAGRVATTHWALFDRLARYAGIQAVDRRHMVIDEGSVLTAAGLFAYQDLALHLIARFASEHLAEQVADFALLDFKSRNQLYYQHFLVNTEHGDEWVLKAQRFCQQADLAQLTVERLAQHVNVSERTLARRFMACLNISPGQYL